MSVNLRSWSATFILADSDAVRREKGENGWHVRVAKLE